MREFKFKVFDKTAKRFLYSVISIHLDGNIHSVTAMNSLGDERTFYAPDIIVCQYTGLKDKQGKEIYEGDITKVESELQNLMSGKRTGKISKSLHVIVWSEDTWGQYLAKNIENRQGEIGFVSKGLVVHAQYCEVVGNIYENEDMLK